MSHLLVGASLTQFGQRVSLYNVESLGLYMGHFALYEPESIKVKMHPLCQFAHTALQSLQPGKM